MKEPTQEMEEIIADWFTLDAVRRWMDLDDRSWEGGRPRNEDTEPESKSSSPSS